LFLGTDADELGDASHRSLVVVLHVLIGEQQHVVVVTVRPPRGEVPVVGAAFDEAHPAERLDVDGTGLEEPPFEEPKRRDQRVAWVAH